MIGFSDVSKPGGEVRALAGVIGLERLPSPVAIIMDGNGRRSRGRRLSRVAGHRAGIEPVRMAVETCARLGIRALTLYAFSVENGKRPRPEVETLWRLLRVFLLRELPVPMENEIRLQAVGRLDALPSPVRGPLNAAIAATADNDGMKPNLAIDCSGTSELVDAVNSILEDARFSGTLSRPRVDEDIVAARLYTAGLPDPMTGRGK